MRSGMGNLLETDSDVASISDSERERTDGDGMESEGLSMISNKTIDATQDSNNGDSSSDGAKEISRTTSASTLNDPIDSNTNEASLQPTCSRENTKELCSSKHDKSSHKSSPRELPPRSQLIQLKPTLKPKIQSRRSSESLTDGVNKQKNPRFVPYEPYRGAVRPMVAQDESSKRHSRNASDVSISSTSLEQAMNNITLNDHHPDLSNAQSTVKDNAQQDVKSIKERKVPVKYEKNSDFANQFRKQEQLIEKQTHALSLLKERLKIAERDNEDLHRENIRLKKLLVDSLSGDIIHTRLDLLTQDGKLPAGANDSVDALSNEIQVWRSKFLSSCVLVEQLTKENSTLTESVGAASALLKDVKLSCSLPPEIFERVNDWLRANRGLSSSQNNQLSDEEA